MVMDLLVVSIPVDYPNSRKVCELIENREFDSQKALRSFLELELGISQEDVDLNHPVFHLMTDFMDVCNDQYLDMDSYFISYVRIVK
jgi:hypothetical protein